ncbi:MAG TPA: gliding motility-associated C-terminal domain-containing protein [Flavobacteriales bacterium]|nr:gliding motility-associated C-terminal domain-containing protein [Flavobacteriales bacterium]
MKKIFVHTTRALNKRAFCSLLLIFFSVHLFSQGSGGMNYDTTVSGSVTRDGDHVLGHVYNYTKCGLGWTNASKKITTRYATPAGTGFPCPLSISGIPAGVIIDKAYLYWNVSYLAGSSTTPTVNLTNPVGTTADYNGLHIGSDGHKCWSELGTRTFRADVTSAIAGDGTYTINTIVGNTVWEIDGATLFIIWYDPSAAWNGTLTLDDGSFSFNATGPGAFGHTVADFMTCSADANAQFFMNVTDMQGGAPTTFSASMHGTPATFTSDFYNWCQLTSPVSAGEVSAFFDIAGGFDCYSVNICGVYFTSSTCGTCPEPLFGINAQANSVSCNGNSDGMAWVNVSSGDPPFTYAWSPVISTNDTIFNLGPGTYYVSVTDSLGNVETDSVVVINPPLLNVIVSASADTICPGSTIVLSAAATGGISPYSYQWSTSGNDTLNSYSTIPPLSGYINVTITDNNGCMISDSVNVMLINMPSINSSNDTCVCNGSSVTLTASGVPSYSWNTGPTTASITVTPTSDFMYVVSYTSGPCTVSDSTFICVYAVPSASILAVDSVCAGTPVTFTALVVSGTTPYTYNWSGLASGITASITATPAFSGTETITILDANGCTTSATTNLVVLPVPIITSSADTCICYGESVNITASGTPVYSWNTGETTATITVSPLVNSTYTVTYSNGICTSTASTDVCVNPLPVVIASADTSVEFDHPVIIHATGTGPFEWSPSNSLSCAICPDPEAAAQETTTYIVSTTNEFGCTAQDDITVSVYYVIHIPNIITPNGDGMNDYFHVIGMPANSSIQIFNRWGNLLYESASYDNKWSTETDGVYYYVFTTPDSKNFSGFFHVAH